MKRKKRIVGCILLTYTLSSFFVGYGSWLLSISQSYLAATPTVDADGKELEPVAYIVGAESTKYTSIEKALDVATSGNIVVAIPATDVNYHDVNNKVVPNKVSYTIRRDCTIKAGVSLVIPTDETTFSTVTDASTLATYITGMEQDGRSSSNTSGNGSTSSYGRFATAYESYYLRATITVSDNVTVTNNGTLVVSGYLSGGTSGACVLGQTSHSYTKISLGSNSKIVQGNANAITYCYGYISEKVKENGSEFDLSLGKLYVPMIIDDYRGFAFSWAMTAGAISTERSSPFNQLEFRNIDSLLNIDYSASVYGIMNLYVTYSTMSVNQVFHKTLALVGNTNSFFVQMNDSTYSSISIKFDKTTLVSAMDFYGGMTMNPMEISFTASIITVDLSTTNSLFPLSYRFDISLNAASGQTLSTYNCSSQRLKVLPGCNVTINDRSTLQANVLTVYSAFYDGTLGNGESSSNMYGSGAYPFKEGGTVKVVDGGKINATSVAGTIYGDTSANITYTSSGTVTSKEAWSYKSSGSTNPAWKTSEYLEIREELQVVPIAYIEGKEKLFVGVNTFTNYNSNVPSFYVKANSLSDIRTIAQYQKVLFFDSLSDYKLDFISNVYKAYRQKVYYAQDESVTYSSSNNILGVVNSTVSISNDNAGINEFNAQSMTVTCTTPLVDGEVPLYVGKTISLAAAVTDIDKVYNKTITWTSLDTSIATVDSNGAVTGVALGTVTIQAECSGVVGQYQATVIEEATIVDIISISIKDGSGNSSDVVAGTSNWGGSTSTNYNGKYGNSKTIVYTLNINPADAPYSSVVWVFTASAAGRQYINDSTVATETISGVATVTVHTGSGTGTSDDKATLKCTVTDLEGTAFTATFIINHQADTSVCILPDSLITMADGSYKKAEDIRHGDMVMAFNHDKGCFEATPIIGNDHMEEDASLHRIMSLRFSDGSIKRIAYEHGFFDLNLNKYVYINENNYLSFIGHSFYGVKSSTDFSKKVIVLKDVTINEEFTKIYSPVTARYLNYLTDDLLGVPGALSGLFNYFEYDPDTLQFDQEKKAMDIAKYGLLSYEDFKDLMPYEIYCLLPCEYLGVSIGKGLLTWDKIKEYLAKFGDQLDMNL